MMFSGEALTSIAAESLLSVITAQCEQLTCTMPAAI
jgi:hypothetical protein